METIGIAALLGVIAGYLGATAFEDLVEWMAYRAIRRTQEYKLRVRIEEFLTPNWEEEEEESSLELSQRISWLLANTSFTEAELFPSLPIGNTPDLP